MDGVSSIVTDTRKLEPGCLFVALRGDKFDGHAFLEQALAGGAKAVVVDTLHSLSTGTPALVVRNTRAALLDIAAGHRARLPMRTVAVTGSSGKTTVKEMTADLLATAAPTARTLGNFNNDIGVPLSLFQADQSHTFGVYEVGMNHPGELAPLCRAVKPAVSIITSVGPVHLEFFEDERGIAEEKATVFRALKRSGRAILCRDEKWFDVLRDAAKCRVITTSLIGGADYVGKIASDGSLRFSVTEKSSGDVVEFTAPLPGDFIVHDALLAIAAARRFGLAWPPLIAAIANYRAAPMRWQREEVRGVTFINDCYNANPLSMTAALDAFASLKVAGRKIAVLAGMGELGATAEELHEQVGRTAASKRFDLLLTIGERGAWIADGANNGETAAPARRSVAAKPPAAIKHLGDVETAADYLRSTLRPGDAVLLKASRTEKLERVFESFREAQSCNGGSQRAVAGTH